MAGRKYPYPNVEMPPQPWVPDPRQQWRADPRQQGGWPGTYPGHLPATLTVPAQIRQGPGMGERFLLWLGPFARDNWRELAPVWVCLGLLMLTYPVRHQLPTPWLLVPLGALLVAGVVYLHRRWPQHPHGLLLWSPPWWAGSAAGVLASWFCIVAVSGGLRLWAGALLLAECCGIAVPWWQHLKGTTTSRRVAATSTPAPEPPKPTVRPLPDPAQAVATLGLPVRVTGVTTEVVEGQAIGHRVSLEVLPTGSPDDVTKAVKKLAVIWKRGEQALWLTPDPLDASRLELRILDVDALAEPVPLPPSAATSIAEEFSIGLYENHAPVLLTLWRRSYGSFHAGFFGQTGFGKSVLMSTTCERLSHMRDVAIIAVDCGNFGVDFAPWRQRFVTLATEPKAATRVLEGLVKVIEVRSHILVERGLTKWIPTPDEPEIRTLIDEVASLPNEAKGFLKEILSKGRKVAVGVVIAGQRAVGEVFDGSTTVRRQLPVRACVRVDDAGELNTIMGQGTAGRGYDQQRLDMPGKFYLQTPELQTPLVARTYWFEPTDGSADTEAVALDPVSAAALAPFVTQSAEDDGAGLVLLSDKHDQALLDALEEAGEEGVRLDDALCDRIGRSRTRVHVRLDELTKSGEVIQQRTGGRGSAARWVLTAFATEPEGAV